MEIKNIYIYIFLFCYFLILISPFIINTILNSDFIKKEITKIMNKKINEDLFKEIKVKTYMMTTISDFHLMYKLEENDFSIIYGNENLIGEITSANDIKLVLKNLQGFSRSNIIQALIILHMLKIQYLYI